MSQVIVSSCCRLIFRRKILSRVYGLKFLSHDLVAILVGRSCSQDRKDLSQVFCRKILPIFGSGVVVLVSILELLSKVVARSRKSCCNFLWQVLVQDDLEFVYELVWQVLVQVLFSSSCLRFLSQDLVHVLVSTFLFQRSCRKLWLRIRVRGAQGRANATYTWWQDLPK